MNTLFQKRTAQGFIIRPKKQVDNALVFWQDSWNEPERDSEISHPMDRKIIKKKWTPLRLTGIAFGFIAVLFLGYSFLFKKHLSKLDVPLNTIVLDTVKSMEFEEFIPVDGIVQPLKLLREALLLKGLWKKGIW